MSVGNQLSEIGRTMEEVFDRRTEHEERRTARTRWNAYEKTLREVKRLAGSDAMRMLAAWLKAEMREERRIPTAREVREEGGRICRDLGFEVPSDTWLDP